MKTNNLWLFAIAFLIIVVLVVIGNIMIIGDHLAKIPYCSWLSYVFYGLIGLLFVWAFVIPALRLHFSPELPSLSINEDMDKGELKNFAGTLLSNCAYIPEKKKRSSHVREVQQRLAVAGSDNAKLREVIEDEISVRIKGNDEIGVIGINKRIDLWAQRVLVTTALSQNSKLDSVIVLWSNYKMVSDIVRAAGFRPNAKQLTKLYFNVFTTAILSYVVSEGLSNMDDIHPFDFVSDSGDEIVDVDISDSDSGSGFSLMGILRKIKIPGIAIESLVDGATNALLTYRIGYITRAYIIEGHDKFVGRANKRRIRRQAVKESFKSMPRAIKAGSAQITSTATSMLSQLYKNL